MPYLLCLRHRLLDAFLYTPQVASRRLEERLSFRWKRESGGPGSVFKVILDYPVKPDNDGENWSYWTNPVVMSRRPGARRLQEESW